LFVLHIRQDEHGAWLIDDYLEYIDALKDKLPLGAKAFALAPWRYDMPDRRCPHDSWVESLVLDEVASAEDVAVRSLEVSARFFGAYHDWRFRLTYKDVQSYALKLERAIRVKAKIGHGDWIIDEICLTKNNLILHEIVFSDSGLWKIVCQDVVHKWL
jgi:hypothetical protein